jgi:tetratricopeptide (TPR) repeat protein
MKRIPIALLAMLLFVPFAASAALAAKGQWEAIEADYKWLETLRNSAPAVDPAAPRKQRIELYLQNERKVEPAYARFIEKLETYYQETGDPRAAQLFAKEKIRIGDGYMDILARYDRAINMYRSALYIDPNNAEAKAKLERAESRRYVNPESFTKVRSGMREPEVQALVGDPREDWIRQKIEGSRVFSVWIYPRRDGGAAAVYFEGGVVYHTNWDAAPAPSPVHEKDEAD